MRAGHTIEQIYAENRKRYDMARNPMGGGPGVTPIGDRPGTTTLPQVETWSGTPAGAARFIALGAFLFFCFVHVAAEARFSD
jgi:hypothetical protein